MQSFAATDSHQRWSILWTPGLIIRVRLWWALIFKSPSHQLVVCCRITSEPVEAARIRGSGRLVAHSETVRQVPANAPSRHLHEFQPLHIGPRQIRGLRPRAAEHHHHAPLRAVAGGIVVASDLLA